MTFLTFAFTSMLLGQVHKAQPILIQEDEENGPIFPLSTVSRVNIAGEKII